MSNLMNSTTPESDRAWSSVDDVSLMERWFTVLGGGALAFYGMSRRSLAGLALAATGGYVAYRGLKGEAPIREGLNVIFNQDVEPVVIEESITINRSPGEVYAFWRDPQNIRRVIEEVKSVQVQDGGRLRWVAEPISGAEIKWHETIVEDRPNERIVWEMAPDAKFESRSSISLKPAPGARGTETTLRVEISPPGGSVGTAIAGLFEPLAAKRLKSYLRHAKQLLEIGEVATVAGQTSGRAEMPSAG